MTMQLKARNVTSKNTNIDIVSLKNCLKWSEIKQFPAKGFSAVEGAFVGVHNNVLIIAGGISFLNTKEQKRRIWHDDIWVLQKEGKDSFKWIYAGKLNRRIAFGASVSTENGLICMGGNNSSGFYSDVFMLSWEEETKTIKKHILPDLPQKCAYGSATQVDDVIYFAGGANDFESETAMNNFWKLDLSKEKQDQSNFNWEILPSWPGPPRAFNITVAQFNGRSDCIYVIGGLCKKKNDDKLPELRGLRDVYEFSPINYHYKQNNQKFWRRRASVPEYIFAGHGIAIGQTHIFIFGIDNEASFLNTDMIERNFFPNSKGIWAYHPVTNTWVCAGKLSINQNFMHAVKWDNSIIIPGAEIQAGIKIPKIYKVSLIEYPRTFGLLNFVIIITYLAIMVGIGLYFTKQNKNTEDFFRGGQKLPWWTSGMSIFATMLSSITFIAIPAKAFATDWTYFIINMTIVLISPFVVFFIMPFFRKIDATSAYEYLEKRYNLIVRLFASASYLLFQVGRLAIVLFLSALALVSILPISIVECILVIGILSIIYCTMGGLKAVVWTDTIQSFVLLGGALLSFILIVKSIDGGLTNFFATASRSGKFHMINWNWSSMSFVTDAFWVILIGGIGQNLVSYTSDQGVIQRYMSVPEQKDAAKTIWTNAIIVIPASLIFFGIGTALFIFYKFNPGKLYPMSQTDSIFPWFITNELPEGIAGLVVAGIFAAAQSTVSTSMNSMSTVFITDFIRRFKVLNTEKGYFILARIITVVVGCLGTALAILFASSNIKSLWDSFMEILGLFGGAMGGLFLLGIFTRRANGYGAIIGAILSAFFLAIIKQKTQVNFLLYATLGIVFCFITGFVFSLVIKENKKSIDGFTIFNQN